MKRDVVMRMNIDGLKEADCGDIGDAAEITECWSPRGF